MADPTVSPTDPIPPSEIRRPVVKPSHYVPLDGPFYLHRLQRARCGKLVDPVTDHALHPTCVRCAELQDEIDGLVF